VSTSLLSNLKKFGVLGSGQMGGGIAQVAAGAGFAVLLADRDLATAEAGKAKIAAGLKKLVEKAKMTEAETQAILSGISCVGGISDLKDADLVVEAATETKRANPARSSRRILPRFRSR
jgi:3-hydroxybutyryl-CoA dehydrogenase